MDGAAVSVLGSLKPGFCMPFCQHCTDEAGHSSGPWNMALEYGGSYPLFSAGPVKRLTKLYW